MKIIFFGTSSFGLPALEAIHQSRHELLAVVSTPNKPRGRNLKIQSSPVKQWSAERKVPTFDFFKENPSQILRILKDLNSDVFVVISFGVILDKEMLRLPRLAPLNVHASLLPKYRGASPMQAAILNQDLQTGVTVMRMAERLDAGDILLKKKIVLDLKETIGSLEKKLSTLAASALLEALDTLESGEAKWAAQTESETSYTKKIMKSDGKIDWNESANTIEAKVRAYLGWPGTFFFFHSKRILVSKVKLGFASRVARAGTVLEVSEDNGILVATAEKTALWLEELQMEGKKLMGWKEFIRGFPLKSGDVFMGDPF